MGIGDWGLGPIPNPQSPNPQSPIPILYLIKNNLLVNFLRKIKSNYLIILIYENI